MSDPNEPNEPNEPSEPSEGFAGFGGFAPEPPSQDEPRPDATFERVPRADEEEYDDESSSDEPVLHSHRRESRSGFRPGALFAALIVLVVIAAIIVGGIKGYHVLKDHLGGSGGSDYSAGMAHGKVRFVVSPSESGTEMGRELKAKGVVASVDAFIAAFEADPDSDHIAPGTYTLQHEMTSDAAVQALLDPAARVQTKVLVREGLRAADIATELGKETRFPAKDFLRLMQHPAGLGLPSYANGNVEGYLFPATYEFGPNDKPVDMLKAMVAQWRQHADADKLDQGLTTSGGTYTPQQVLTVASLVQEEGKTPADMAKIARVIYNRIENPGTEGQAGVLQIDATVDYGLHRPLTVGLTDADRQTDTPYNTYLHPGLPPGPIGNPGDAAIKAALHPATGDWYYYITVNLATGETKFAHTYDEFLTYKQQHDEYCATQSASRCQ